MLLASAGNRIPGGELRSFDDNFDVNAAELLRLIRGNVAKLACRGTHEEPLERGRPKLGDSKVGRNWGIEQTIEFLKQSTELGKSTRFDENFDEKRHIRTLKYLQALLYNNDDVLDESKCTLAINQDPALMLLDNLSVPAFMEDAAYCVKTLCGGQTHGGGIRDFRTGELPSVLFRTDTCVVQWPADLVW